MATLFYSHDQVQPRRTCQFAKWVISDIEGRFLRDLFRTDPHLTTSSGDLHWYGYLVTCLGRAIPIELSWYKSEGPMFCFPDEEWPVVHDWVRQLQSPLEIIHVQS